MKTKENLIKEYVKSSGGALFNIDSIDTIRDGGTKLIKIDHYALKRAYYIHKDNYTLHDAYPVSDENIIKDKNLEAYLMDRIVRYVESVESEAIRSRNLLNKLIKNEN
jgi:hypothetical protein